MKYVFQLEAHRFCRAPLRTWIPLHPKLTCSGEQGGKRPAAPSHCVEGNTYLLSPYFSAVVVTQLMPGLIWMNHEFTGLEKKPIKTSIYTASLFFPLLETGRLRYSRHISHKAEHVFFINIHCIWYFVPMEQFWCVFQACFGVFSLQQV